MLDDLSNALQVPYLSELREPCWTQAMAQWVAATPAQAYSVQQWTEALEYLYDQTMENATAEQLHAQLLALLLRDAPRAQH